MPELQRFNITVRICNPDDSSVIAEHVLPVDSPDPEHAAASTMSNAISFTTKTEGGVPLPVTFQVVKIEKRI
jgi:hypothetical protein